MLLPSWLQAELRRTLASMESPLARNLARELELGAESRRELALAAARALAKQPAVREIAERVAEDIEVLREAARQRRDGQR